MQQFISFLGQIGIDVNLLIAQIINFAILLWILNKFVYRSIVKHIEEEETELKKAQILQEKLTTENDKFLKQKKDEMTKLKKLSRQKIMEAGELAEEIKKQAKAEAQKETDEMIAQMKKQLASKQGNLKDQRLQDTKQQILKNVMEIAKKLSGSSSSVTETMQNYFLDDLAGKLDDFPKETFAETAPDIILETAFPLSASQKDNVQKFLSGKFKHAVETTQKTNPDLIAGYRLEISGNSIENNLLNELQHATETV